MGVKSNSRTPQTSMFALVQRSSRNFKTTCTGHFLSFAHNHHRSLRTVGPGLRTTRPSIPSCPRISPLIRTQSEAASNALKRPMSTTTFPNATTTQPDHDLETQPAKKQRMNGTPKVRITPFLLPILCLLRIVRPAECFLTSCANCGFFDW